MRKFLLLLAMVLAYTSLYAKTYVMIAGVSKYPGNVKNLWFDANDAKVMKNLYVANGNSYVITLTDSLATPQRVLKGLKQAFSKAKKEDAIVFFFAGHGYPGGFMCYGGTISYEEIINIMKKSKARNKMVFADACYSGKARYSNERTQKKYNQNIMFFLSSRSNEFSWQLSTMKNSFFTAYLERGMRGAADSNRDKKVSAHELYEYVHTRVVERADTLNQHPVMWGNFDDNMTIIDWNNKR